ncbi:hypothetical protein C7212DRAFT_359222 [Tuber magnatum]|uniref:C2H2-type domain-containing protein n=1 Tax=Tuber magnatum TaxID=42249 RepID=A0A317SIF0_9PEZI|nr:hypothetical protein C7212DRAFT_359222 [Tuber magnatum]
MPDDKKKTAYGTETGGDTARERESQDRAASKLHQEAKLAGKKFHRPPTPPDASSTSARASRLNLEENLNKTTLVPAGAGVGKRGRGAGFYCEACDLTFKDSLQWVDHLNSKQHLHAVGERDEVVVATLEMVVERLAWLKRRRDEEGRDGEVDLARRLAERARVEEEERVQRREKRKVARRERKEKERKLGNERGIGGGDSDSAERGGDGEEEDPDAVAMARMMGFTGGFGTTKKRS